MHSFPKTGVFPMYIWLWDLKEASLLKFHLKKKLSCILWKPHAHSKATSQVLDDLLLLRDDVLYLSVVLYLIYIILYIISPCS